MPEKPVHSNIQLDPFNEQPLATGDAPASHEDTLLRAVAELDKEPQPFRPLAALDPNRSQTPAFGLSQPGLNQPKKSKKKLVVVISAIVVLLLGAGGGTAFALWFNSSDVVTADTLKNLISSKTFINRGTYTSDDHISKGSVELTFNSQANIPQYAGALDVQAKINYKNFAVDLSGSAMMSEGGNIYLKLNNTKNFIDRALTSNYGKFYSSDPKLKSAVEAFVAKIDGKWIKLDQATFFLPGDFAVQRTCEKKALLAYYNDKSQQNQIIDAFAANRFVSAKSNGKSETINGQDSIGYSVSYNAKTSNAFDKALQETKLGKALNSCTGNETFSGPQSRQDQQAAQQEADKTKTTIWISRWTHQLTRVDVSSSDSATTTNFNATFQSNQTVQLKDPPHFVKLSDLQKDIDNITTLTVNNYSSP